MGAEVLGAEVAAVPVKDGSEVESSFVNEKENGELNQDSVDEPIKFGTHGADGPVKGEGEAVKDTHFPKDAVDEWPEPKQIYTFYFVKVRSYDDPKLKSKIDLADREIQKKNQERFQLTEAISAKKSERAQIISQLKPLTLEDKRFRGIFDEKRREREPLQQALGKLRSANNANRERGVSLCSSEEELNERIQHESNTLTEEKQLLRDIKQLEGTRDKVIANAAMKAKIQESLGQKEAIEDQVKLIGLDMDGARKEQQAIRSKIKLLEEDLKVVDNEIASLQEELRALVQKREKAYEGLVELRKQRDEGNAHFYQNRALLNNAKDLAARKDVAALEELCNAEGWEDPNPDEKPLVEPVAPVASETVAKPNTKRPKEEPKPSPQHDNVPTQKVQKEEKNKVAATELKVSSKGNDSQDTETAVPEKPRNDPAPADVIDEAKLKEMKREEEIAKAKSALERKKKLAEKAAAKAAVRAQKEAEKKVKEREKKAKKKAAATSTSTTSEEQAEADSTPVEPENTEEEVEASIPSKNKELKESSNVRFINRRKTQDPLPKKIMLKRKKSTPYWVYAVPAALFVLILIVTGYYYLY
ncbi:hypothetical protein Syun_008449 [Stephania yunnanensis]|uniref:Proton pump-interactor 1 n=1 Tax=Stephania yunnanensis TaxID=152371 RepID=A0AAP0KDT4_9MAGN